MVSSGNNSKIQSNRVTSNRNNLDLDIASKKETKEEVKVEKKDLPKTEFLVEKQIKSNNIDDEILNDIHQISNRKIEQQGNPLSEYAIKGNSNQTEEFDMDNAKPYDPVISTPNEIDVNSSKVVDEEKVKKNDLYTKTDSINKFNKQNEFGDNYLSDIVVRKDDPINIEVLLDESKNDSANDNIKEERKSNRNYDPYKPYTDQYNSPKFGNEDNRPPKDSWESGFTSNNLPENPNLKSDHSLKKIFETNQSKQMGPGSINKKPEYGNKKSYDSWDDPFN